MEKSVTWPLLCIRPSVWRGEAAPHFPSTLIWVGQCARKTIRAIQCAPSTAPKTSATNVGEVSSPVSTHLSFPDVPFLLCKRLSGNDEMGRDWCIGRRRKQIADAEVMSCFSSVVESIASLLLASSPTNYSATAVAARFTPSSGSTIGTTIGVDATTQNYSHRNISPTTLSACRNGNFDVGSVTLVTVLLELLMFSLLVCVNEWGNYGRY